MPQGVSVSRSVLLSLEAGQLFEVFKWMFEAWELLSFPFTAFVSEWSRQPRGLRMLSSLP